MAKSKKTPGKARSHGGKAVKAKPTPSPVPAKDAMKPGDDGRSKPIKTYLVKKELEEFREMLLAKRRSLLGDLDGMAEQTIRQHDTGNLSSMPTHMADVGTDNFEHEFTLGLLESEQALLREINEALQRIDDRSYGICLGTSQPIPKTRLKAKPWAKYTVEYARMLEKGLVRAPQAQHPEEEEGELEGDGAEQDEEIVEEEPEQAEE